MVPLHVRPQVASRPGAQLNQLKGTCRCTHALPLPAVQCAGCRAS